MKNNYIEKVINHFFKEKHNKETELKVQKWLVEDEDLEQKDEILLNIWEDIDEKADADTYKSLIEVQQKLGMKKSHKKLWHNPFLRIAVVMIPLISFLTLYTFLNRDTNIIEISTIAGEQKEITLPDGSIVLINACSKISYPKEFKDNKREVKLNGEALFTVTKDISRKFIVTTKDINVEVLGTKFNLRSYSEDNIASTTLLSGKIEVTLDDKEYILTPNQELIYNRTDRNHIIQAFSESNLLWTDGIIMFNEATLDEIIEGIQRQYSVKFEYNISDFTTDKYSVKFSNGDTIETIMDVIQDLVGDFSYNVNNSTITLTSI